MTPNNTMNRRGFIRKISRTVSGTAALAVAAPMVTAEPVSAPVASTRQSAPTQQGYQLTPHVQTYYQLADF